MEEKMRREVVNSSGFALPMVLALLVVSGLLGALLTRMAVTSLDETLYSTATLDTSLAAEGALHHLLHVLSQEGETWRTEVPLVSRPKDYKAYYPHQYSEQNGLPKCTQLDIEGEYGCERNLHPEGGGLLKNYGPVVGASGPGTTVASSKRITDQLDSAALPEPDVELNGRPAWYQVERLQVALPNTSSSGLSLGADNPTYGVWFRVTATSIRKVRDSTGQSVATALIELPPI